MIKLINALVSMFVHKRQIDPYRERKIERSRKEFRADARNYP